MFLSEKCDIWRQSTDTSKPGRKALKAWRKGVACHLEPISATDHTVQFALESTHVVYLPVWLVGLRREDEIRLSGRLTADGTRVPRRYVVRGIRRFGTFGLRHQEAFCLERE